MKTLWFFWKADLTDVYKRQALHGLTRSLIHNMVIGVSEGYTKELEVNGVGYRAQKQGKKMCIRDR